MRDVLHLPLYQKELCPNLLSETWWITLRWHTKLNVKIYDGEGDHCVCRKCVCVRARARACVYVLSVGGCSKAPAYTGSIYVDS
jgi:hypothetical protein